MDYYFIEEFGKKWLADPQVSRVLESSFDITTIKKPLFIIFSDRVIEKIRALMEVNVEYGGTLLANITVNGSHSQLHVIDIKLEENISRNPEYEFLPKNRYYYRDSIIQREKENLFPIPFHTHPDSGNYDFITNVQVSDGDKEIASEEILHFNDQKILLPQIIISKVGKNDCFVLAWGGGIADNDPFKWCSIAFGESLPDLWEWIKKSVKESDLAKIVLAAIGTAWTISFIRKPGETIAGTLLTLLVLLGHEAVHLHN
jgi:hypothetical protein